MFAGFTQTDFEAYAPNKWKSNVFNRERLEVKQKLLALGRELQGSLQGSDGSPLVVEASVEHPALWNHKQVEAQHLFFSRSEGARKELDAIIDRQKPMASLIDDPTPLRNHVFLAVTLNQGALELSVKLHPDAKVDRDNLERKGADHFEREKLLHLLHGLDPVFRIGVLPELTPVRELDDERLAALMHQAAQPAPMAAPGTPPRMFYVGRTLARAEAVALAPEALTSWTRETLVSLLAIYRFIAWSRDNDFLSMREALQREKAQKRQRGLAKHDEVRIVRGMFAGKKGVIQEIDAKGALKVLIGKMAVKIDVEDVTKG